MSTSKAVIPHRIPVALCVLAFSLFVLGYHFGRALALSDNQADVQGAAADRSASPAEER